MKLILSNIKNVIWIVALLGCAYLGYISYISNNTMIHSNPITIKKVKEIAEILSLEVTLSGFVDGYSNTFFIQKHVVASITANAIISTNIDSIKLKADIKSKHVTIVMSVPRVSSIDVEQFKIVSSSEKTFGIMPRLGYINTDTHDSASVNALFEGKKMIKEKANNSENIEQAKKHVDDIMSNLFKTVGWSIEIDWVNR